MPFDLPEVPKKVTKSPTDDMVILGHMAAAGIKKKTTKVVKRQPLPKEARRGFILAFGIVCFVLLVALVRAHS